MKEFKTKGIIFCLGTLLVCLRLLFPVLQCRVLEIYEDYVCKGGRVLFFAFGPQKFYSISNFRTYTQIFVIAILTGIVYLVLKKKEE